MACLRAFSKLNNNDLSHDFFRNLAAAFETCSRTLNKRWYIRHRRQGKPETTSFPKMDINGNKSKQPMLF